MFQYFKASHGNDGICMLLPRKKKKYYFQYGTITAKHTSIYYELF